MITTCLYVSNADTTEDVAAACANAELNHGCSSFCGFVAYHCDSMQAFSSSYCADTMHRSLLTAAFNVKLQNPEWISLLRFVLDIPRSTKIVCIHVLFPHKQGLSQWCGRAVWACEARPWLLRYLWIPVHSNNNYFCHCYHVLFCIAFAFHPAQTNNFFPLLVFILAALVVILLLLS